MNLMKVIVGGFVLAGVAATGYRAYELRKLKKAVENEQIIEIEVENAESNEIKH